ncbi:MAG: hypothetical protein PHE99_06395 [Bacteroidales bacterium]|nr:hypothetical protein [Bacteroidales bacterium]MDD4657293.1 hypothetical protein [Bacteroidales bacterium]
MKIEEYIPSMINIEKTEWFSLLTESQKELLSSSGGRINYSEGETIVKQGFAASHIVFFRKRNYKIKCRKQKEEHYIQNYARG